MISGWGEGSNVFLCLSTRSGKIDAVCAGTYQLSPEAPVPEPFSCSYDTFHFYARTQLLANWKFHEFLRTQKTWRVCFSLPRACLEKRAGLRGDYIMPCFILTLLKSIREFTGSILRYGVKGIPVCCFLFPDVTLRKMIAVSNVLRFT